jgi:hypothetical protein
MILEVRGLDEIRVKAYKKLIHQAFLDIKNNSDLQESFHIAHSFHNLSEFLIYEFDGLDEVDFWNRIRYLEKTYGLNHYRRLFDETINGGSY